MQKFGYAECWWFVWTVYTTVGFGDWIPVTPFGRIMAVLLHAALATLLMVTLVCRFSAVLSDSCSRPCSSAGGQRLCNYSTFDVIRSILQFHISLSVCMFFSSTEAEEKLFEKMQNSKFMRKQRKEAVCFVWNWSACTWSCNCPFVVFYAVHRYSYHKHRVSTMDMLRARDRWVQFQMVSSSFFTHASLFASSLLPYRQNRRPRFMSRMTFFRRSSKCVCNCTAAAQRLRHA